jgi:hypothetical protein
MTKAEEDRICAEEEASAQRGCIASRHREDRRLALELGLLVEKRVGTACAASQSIQPAT